MNCSNYLHIKLNSLLGCLLAVWLLYWMALMWGPPSGSVRLCPLLLNSRLIYVKFFFIRKLHGKRKCCMKWVIITCGRLKLANRRHNHKCRKNINLCFQLKTFCFWSLTVCPYANKKSKTSFSEINQTTAIIYRFIVYQISHKF